MLDLNPVVYLPIELKSRDLDARLLIAAHCLKRGFCVAIGQQWSLQKNIDAMPRGCILFKSVNAIPAAVFVRAKSAGHLVVATDEEAVARRTVEFLPHSVDKTALENCDQFYAQSDLQADAIRARFPDITPNIEVTGNARLDLLSEQALSAFSDDVREIRSRYTPFVLVNTNFTHTNSVWGGPQDVARVLVQAGALDPTNDDDRAMFLAYVETEERVQQQIVALIKWAADALPEVNLVVRPHPAENSDNWTRAFDASPKIAVISGQNPVPWIMASEVLVHSNCTTGLEAALMGRPALNLLPDQESRWALRYVMSEVNQTFRTWEEVATVLKNVGRKKKIMEAGAPVESALRRFFPGYKAHDAAEKIASRMAALLEKHGIGPESANAWRTARQTWKAHERTKVQEDKVNILPEEFQQRFDAIRPLADLQISVQFAQIDHSLFLMMPAD